MTQENDRALKQPAHEQQLGDGLVLRTARLPDDVEAIAAFNSSVHGQDVDGLTRSLLMRHPNMTARDQILVENANGEIVSTLCLIPWTWRYAGVDLPMGEMGIVGTAPEYRGQGLVRAQTSYFKQRLAERGCLLSAIQGIPYFYRQFGYQYAIPLEGGWRLELRTVPKPSSDRYVVRPATIEDLPVLKDCYDAAVSDLTLHTVRDAAVWRFLLEPYDRPDATSHMTFVVTEMGSVAGYFRVAEFHFGQELTIDEASNLEYEAILAALHHAKLLAHERKEPGIRLNLPDQSPMVQLAQSWGAHDGGRYAWQIHVPDWVALLRALVPVLEQRLSASLFAGLTRNFRISTYRSGFELVLEEGRIQDVRETNGPPEPNDGALPPDCLVPLILGQKSVADLRTAFPDVNVHGEWRLLLDTLFAPASAFIYPMY